MRFDAVRSLIVVMGALTAVSCGGAQSRYASHMERGRQYFSQGNLDKARIEFGNALQIAPKNAEALYFSGQVAERHGAIREAAGLYQAAVDARPDYAAARASLARIFVLAGDPARATALIAPALALHPEDAELLAVRGAARAELKDLAGARADVKRAVEIAPTNENAIALLAAIYQRNGEIEAAIALVHHAVDQIPASLDLHQVLAELYLSNGQTGNAERQLRTLVGLRPQEASRRYALANFYVRTHQLDAAQRALEEAVEAQPDSDEPKLALAEFISMQRSRAQGEKILRDFIARDPHNYDLRLGLGALLQRTGAPQEAADIYAEVIKLDGTGAKGLLARDSIAAIRVSEGRYDESAKLIAEVLTNNPRDNDALILRGNIALERHDPAAAIADLRAVVRDQPGASGVQRTLARAYAVNGEPALAEETLRAAIDAAPADTSLRIELAQLMGQTGRSEAAITLLEDTVHRLPSDFAAREALARAYIATRNWQAASTAVNDLQTLRPDAAVGSFLAGVVAQGQNHLEQSQRAFERALELQPGATDALVALSKVQLARGQSAAALAHVQAVINADPKSSSVNHNLLGELLMATKAYPQAVEEFTRVVHLAPTWGLPYRNLALAKLAVGDVAGATAGYEAGVKMVPNEAALVIGLATLYEQQGRIDAAIAQYVDLHARNPHLEVAANNLAMLLVTYKTDQHSIDRARDLTVAFASSNSAALLDTRGWVSFKRGDLGDALPVLERALDRSPESQVIRYHLAMAELKAGQRDQARTNLQTALARGTNFAGIDEARATLASLSRREAG